VSALEAIEQRGFEDDGVGMGERLHGESSECALACPLRQP
jgi:hypothetical protein